jgi:hypothetical protein
LEDRWQRLRLSILFVILVFAAAGFPSVSLAESRQGGLP